MLLECILKALTDSLLIYSTLSSYLIDQICSKQLYAWLKALIEKSQGTKTEAYTNFLLSDISMEVNVITVPVKVCVFPNTASIGFKSRCMFDGASAAKQIGD